MKKVLLALIVVLAVASMSMGVTFAGFCDTDMVTDNYFSTGDMDLKVAKAGDPAFYDDQPWGTGLFPEEIEPDVFENVPCFMAEEDSNFANYYTGNFRLWNAGTTHGKAYVHIRGVAAESLQDAGALLNGTTVTLWYDLDNDGDDRDNADPAIIDAAEVVEGTLGGLDCLPVPIEPAVWLLPAGEWRNLEITIDPPDGAPGDSLTFHIQFNLAGFYFDDDDMVGVGFCDTEICLDNCLRVKEQ
jgi:hypothetical protein